jgi:CRISPR/Cas system CSM-associated protein Csm3 (group 7 of RAMP superfamily)
MPVTRADTKPYDFVPLNTNGKETAALRGHERWRNLTGTLTCTLTAVTPVHVGSGLIVPVSELHGHGDINWPDGFSETLVLSHYRTSDERVIPASSLKGSIRSIVEAISPSCIRVSVQRKVNKELFGENTPFGRMQHCNVAKKQTQKPEQVALCPACRLFGAMSFEANVHLHDALQSSGNGQIVLRPAPNQPNKTNDGRHSTHRDKYYNRAANGNWYVKGRKFYHHFRRPENQSVKFEPIEVCSSGSTFTFQLDFENLLESELGLLLVALGQGDDAVKLFKLGGSKPFGYGAVEVTHCEGKVWDEQGWRKRCYEWDDEGVSPLEWTSVRDTALTNSRALILSGALRRLQQILDEQATMREHPPEDIARWRRGEDKYE